MSAHGNGVPSEVQYHILYWEGQDKYGITFDLEDDARAKGGYSRGPGRCISCRNMANTFRQRLDNMQSSLRMCVEPGGLKFRKEIVNFICLSPRMSIMYELDKFHRYLVACGTRHLTEETVLGTALSVDRGEVEAEACGVEISSWPDAPSGEVPHEAWLKAKVKEIRASAAARGGASAGLMLDKNGFEVGAFGVDVAMFACRPAQPIREVVILLGGPKGIEDDVLPGILGIFGDGGEDGFHLGTLKVKLPGGLQHSYVALGDLLSFHDRGFLLPIMEDYQQLGHNEYSSWREQMTAAVSGLANSSKGLAEKKAALRNFLESMQALHDTEKIGEALQAGETEEKTDAQEPHLAGDADITPMDVERFVSELEARGTLPRRRPWRARQCLRAVEPRRALQVLRTVRKKRHLAIASGIPMLDFWDQLCTELDALLSKAPPGKTLTHLGVAEALAELRDKTSTSPSKATRLVSAVEVTALGELPCEQAVRLLQSIYGRRDMPAVPAATGDGGEVAKEAAFWAARIKGGSQAEVVLRRATKKVQDACCPPSREAVEAMLRRRSGQGRHRNPHRDHPPVKAKRKLQPRQPAHPPPGAAGHDVSSNPEFTRRCQRLGCHDETMELLIDFFAKASRANSDKMWNNMAHCLKKSEHGSIWDANAWLRNAVHKAQESRHWNSASMAPKPPSEPPPGAWEQQSDRSGERSGTQRPPEPNEPPPWQRLAPAQAKMKAKVKSNPKAKSKRRPKPPHSAPPPPPPPPHRKEEDLRSQAVALGLDGECIHRLMQEPITFQRDIMQQVSTKRLKNPSSWVAAEITKKRQRDQGSSHDDHSWSHHEDRSWSHHEEGEEMIWIPSYKRWFQIDARCSELWNRVPKEDQTWILDQVECRGEIDNFSAFLASKVNDHLNSKGDRWSATSGTERAYKSQRRW
eukprot:TRINITY_DN27222_c0_g1_i1.p1 TRINITY_DN27222_c0_g1~~TRINITY_DN27222_c0_g1_i1.p1  ORF type:complete len:920 (+),score=202.79 TRINITY_DN27222_c0_g1_i1:27-2786(+)